MSLTGSMGATGMMNAIMGKDMFLQLLSTQMQNQNPLDPMDNTEFVSQLAQFSSLEQMSNMNLGIEALYHSFGSLLQLVEFDQAKGLIGDQIIFQNPETGEQNQTGRVDGVRMENGEICLVVNGLHVPLGYVEGIDATAESADPTDAGDATEGTDTDSESGSDA